MWQRAFLYLGSIAALFSAQAIDTDASALASVFAARSTDHTAITGATGTGIQRASDGLFYVNAEVGAGETRLVVDTGASHVILSHSDARKAISRPNPGQAPAIVTAAGTIEADWVIIEKLELQGHILNDVQAAVPRRDTGISLLGQSALVRFDSLRIEGDRLSFVR